MWVEILTVSGFQILILLLLILFGDQMFSLSYTLDTPDYVTKEMVQSGLNIIEGEPTDKLVLFSIVFTMRIFFQLFDYLIYKTKDERDWREKYADWQLLILVLSFLTIYTLIANVKPVNDWFRLTSLTAKQLLFCIICCFVSLVQFELGTIYRRRMSSVEDNFKAVE